MLFSKVITGPEVEPILIDEAKLHLSVTHNDENAMILIIIQAAREIAENYTNRSFITQTRQMKLDRFPRCSELILPSGPVTEVTVNYYDETDTLVEFTDYWFDDFANVPKIISRNSWPSVFDRPNAVLIEYTAGYGGYEDVPKPIRQAMLLIIKHLYDNREQVGDSMSQLPFGATTLLGPYVVEHSVVLK